MLTTGVVSGNGFVGGAGGGATVLPEDVAVLTNLIHRNDAADAGRVTGDQTDLSSDQVSDYDSATGNAYPRFATDWRRRSPPDGSYSYFDYWVPPTLAMTSYHDPSDTDPQWAWMVDLGDEQEACVAGARYQPYTNFPADLDIQISSDPAAFGDANHASWTTVYSIDNDDRPDD